MSDSSRIVASELRKSVQDLRDERAERAAKDHRDSGVCHCPQPLPSRQYMGSDNRRIKHQDQPGSPCVPILRSAGHLYGGPGRSAAHS